MLANANTHYVITYFLTNLTTVT